MLLLVDGVEDIVQKELKCLMEASSEGQKFQKEVN